MENPDKIIVTNNNLLSPGPTPIGYNTMNVVYLWEKRKKKNFFFAN